MSGWRFSSSTPPLHPHTPPQPPPPHTHSAFDALPHSTRRSLQDSLSAPLPAATTTNPPPSTSSQERFVLTAKIDVGTEPDYPRVNLSQLTDAVYAALGRNGSDPLHPIAGSEVR